MTNYGEALRYQREINGYTQSSLARATGLKQSMISWWEADKGLPNIDFCVKLAKFYGITLDELLGIEDDITEKVGSSNVTYTSEEREIIESYRQLDIYGRKLIKQNLDVLLAKDAVNTNRGVK